MRCACGVALAVQVISRAGAVIQRFADCPACGRHYDTAAIPPQPHEGQTRSGQYARGKKIKVPLGTPHPTIRRRGGPHG